MFANDKHHNESCTVYSLGCVVQNTKDCIRDGDTWMYDTEHSLGRSLAEYFVDQAVEFLNSGMVDCRCEDGPVSSWHPGSRETYALGMVFYITNSNPDTTNRI